jgi:hypothetical protein
MCTVCGRPILVMAFRGTEFDSENCRKIKEGDAHFNQNMS